MVLAHYSRAQCIRQIVIRISAARERCVDVKHDRCCLQVSPQGGCESVACAIRGLYFQQHVGKWPPSQAVLQRGSDDCANSFRLQQPGEAQTLIDATLASSTCEAIGS